MVIDGCNNWHRHKSCPNLVEWPISFEPDDIFTDTLLMVHYSIIIMSWSDLVVLQLNIILNANTFTRLTFTSSKPRRLFLSLDKNYGVLLLIKVT